MAVSRLAVVFILGNVPLICAFNSLATCEQIKIVDPVGLEDVEGNSSVGGATFSFRSQEMHPSASFQGLPEGGAWLVGFADRTDTSSRRPVTVNYDHVKVTVSTSQRERLSAVFAENTGPDAVTVVDGPVALTYEVDDDPPNPFSGMWEVDPPFYYDPAMGNLVMDFVSNSGLNRAFRWDAQRDAPGVTVNAGPVRSLRADTFFRNVVVTQFIFETTLPLQVGLMAGDSDQDLDFDQLDLVQVHVAAKYLNGQPATWGEGDWNGAPGGSPGIPPAGDGAFDQLDIIAALAPGHYLTGPYATVQSNGELNDGQTSVFYNVSTGEIGVDSPAGIELTSINVDSSAGIFTGDPAQNLGGSFDNDADNNIFKATFGSSFGSVSFGNVAQAGLSEEFVLGDLTVIGSLAGGGDLGEVDLVYVPEPSSLLLLCLASLFLATRRSRFFCMADSFDAIYKKIGR